MALLVPVKFYFENVEETLKKEEAIFLDEPFLLQPVCVERAQIIPTERVRDSS